MIESKQGLDGARAEAVLDLASITVNKNSVPGDKSAIMPGGLRVGAPALTTRGFVEADFEMVADCIHRGCQIALDLKNSLPQGHKMKDFKAMLAERGQDHADIAALRKSVHDLAVQFPLPGL